MVIRKEPVRSCYRLRLSEIFLKNGRFVGKIVAFQNSKNLIEEFCGLLFFEYLTC